jgi:hypothetical protein
LIFGVRELRFAQANAQPNPDFYREQKSFHLTDPKEKLFLKNFQRFKKNNKRNAQPTLNDTTTQ